jgi:hypothetical protein
MNGPLDDAVNGPRVCREAPEALRLGRPEDRRDGLGGAVGVGEEVEDLAAGEEVAR